MPLFIGDDWSHSSHDIQIQDEAGRVLAARQLPEGAEGITQFHALVADAGAEDPADVFIGIEKDHGPWVHALQASGYEVICVNPRAVARYRERYSMSGAKSDPGDAAVLADVIRTDRHLMRPMAADSDEVKSLKVLTRSHQSLIWARQQHANALLASLREYYPGALNAFPGKDLVSADACAVLAKAPTPAKAAKLTPAKIAAALRSGGRKRYIDSRAREIHDALHNIAQLPAPDVMADALGAAAAAQVAVIATLNAQIRQLETQIASGFDVHPDADIIRSLPGLGPTLGARMLAESGDDPNRFADAKARRNYAGTSPVTKRSGTKIAIFARFTGNRYIRDTAMQWAMRSLPWSPEAAAYYQRHLKRTGDERKARRALANKWIGILHGCLTSRTPYDPTLAWPEPAQQTAAA